MKISMGARPLLFPTPVFAVGTYDREGKPNVMIVAWGGLCCSQPPSVAISVRKPTYTYSNLMEKKSFTISIPSEDYIKEADYFGMVSGKTEDKFSKAGLTPERADHVDAPYVKEFPLILECRVTHVVEIGLHTQFIGEILDVKIDEDKLDEKRLPVIERLKPFSFIPDSRTYYGFSRFLGKAFLIGKEIKERS